MDDYDFSHDMTDEQVRRAKAAGRIARKQASGSNLDASLEVGENLLVGRAVAMKAARVSQPNGKQYAQAFARWKNQFGFTADTKGLPLPTQYLDNCILAAANRTITNKIIADLSPAQRAGMGISGLAARVRNELKPKSDSAAPRMTPAQQMMDQFNNLASQVIHEKSAGEALRRYGLAIDENGELMVFDEEKFMTWFAARRRPRLTIEGRAER